MSDRTNPFREGMAAAQEGQPERSNPYTYGSHNWLRWQGGHRNAVALAEQLAARERTQKQMEMTR